MPIDLRAVTNRLCRFRSTAGNEAPAADWFESQLDDCGFETITWDADAKILATHSSFPDDPTDIDVTGRRSVAGIIECGTITATSPTVVLNGHLDVVPADEGDWSSDPFEPTWGNVTGEADSRHDDTGDDTLTARGATDMKAGVVACLGAALDVQAAVRNGALDGAEETDPGGVRVVVEAVAGEEDGGYGAATATLSNPYPFDRNAAIVAEPTDLRPVVATEGSLMAEVTVTGRSAHAATRWHGEDVLPHFERIRETFMHLERERGEQVTHPLYESFPVPWPVVCGTVTAGSWASTVPAALTAAFRIGVAPGETVDEVEQQFTDRLAELAAEDPWLREHPPTFERIGVQFESAEIDPAAPIVEAVQAGRAAVGLPDAAPEGVTYGADSRHYVAAGIPTVVFGPGQIEQAHYPDETIRWGDVETARSAIAEAIVAYAREFQATVES